MKRQRPVKQSDKDFDAKLAAFNQEARTLVAADVLISTTRTWTPEARALIDRRLAEAGADAHTDTVETPPVPLALEDPETWWPDSSACT